MAALMFEEPTAIRSADELLIAWIFHDGHFRQCEKITSSALPAVDFSFPLPTTILFHFRWRDHVQEAWELLLGRQCEILEKRSLSLK